MNPKQLIELKEKEIEDMEGSSPIVINLWKAELKALKQMNQVWLDRIENLDFSNAIRMNKNIGASKTQDRIKDELKNFPEGTKNE